MRAATYSFKAICDLSHEQKDYAVNLYVSDERQGFIEILAEWVENDKDL